MYSSHTNPTQAAASFYKKTNMKCKPLKALVKSVRHDINTARSHVGELCQDHLHVSLPVL